MSNLNIFNFVSNLYPEPKARGPVQTNYVVGKSSKTKKKLNKKARARLAKARRLNHRNH